MKKIFALALAAMMALAAFAGCSNGNSAKDDSFVIGGIGPLTGDYATYGVSVKQGAELTFTVEGPDEDAAAEALETFLKANL